MICSPLLTTFSNFFHGFGVKNEEAPLRGLVTVKQVHGTYLYFVGEERRIERPGYDILMTDQPRTPIGVKTADCLPILMVEPERKIVAAVHAGWRGTLEGVVQRAIGDLNRRGASVEKLAVGMGPAIGSRCYEVGRDVAASFEKVFPEGNNFLQPASGGKWFLDLAGANRAQLISAGVRPEKIDLTQLCTHCRPDLFHSYRRDGDSAGRMVNFIEIL